MPTFHAEIESGTNVQSQPENIRSCIFIPIPVRLCLAVSMAAQAVRSGPMCLRSADEFEETHLRSQVESLAKTGRKNGQEEIGSRLVQRSFPLVWARNSVCLCLCYHTPSESLRKSGGFEISNQTLGNLLPVIMHP